MRKEKPQPSLPRVELPKGFKILSSGDYAKTHDFQKEPVLIGKPEAIREVKIKNKLTRVMTIVNGTGKKSAVWESVQLKNLFDEVSANLKKVKSVFIRYEGEQKVKGYKNKMKVFTAGIQ